MFYHSRYQKDFKPLISLETMKKFSEIDSWD